MNLNILYEDNDIIVCVKPAGIATQTARATQQDMVSLLKNERAKKQESTYIGVVHRLDQPVEGILVFAKTEKAAAALSREIAENHMHKQYLAIVSGTLPKEGRLEDTLLKDGRNNLSRVVAKGTKGAKDARLSYEVLAESEQDAVHLQLLRIHLETGRHHQIRVQLSHAGAPILGDQKYGKTQGNGSRGGSHSGMALCSASLIFTHPVTKESMKFDVLPQGRTFLAFADYFQNSDMCS